MWVKSVADIKTHLYPVQDSLKKYIELPQPVLIRPGYSYSIGVSVGYSYRFPIQIWQKKMQLESGIILEIEDNWDKFDDESNFQKDDDEVYGIISKLNLTKFCLPQF